MPAPDWVFPTIPHGHLEPRRGSSRGRSTMANHGGGWAEEGIFATAFVSAPAFKWGLQLLLSSIFSITIIPLPPIIFFCFLLPTQGSGLLPRAPILVLRFSYICPDRKMRRYVVLESDAHAAVQVMGPRRLWGRWEDQRQQLQQSVLRSSCSQLPSVCLLSGATCCANPFHCCDTAAA